MPTKLPFVAQLTKEWFLLLISYFLSLAAAAAAATTITITTNTDDDYGGNGNADADADADQHEPTHRTIYDRPVAVAAAQVALNRAQASA